MLILHGSATGTAVDVASNLYRLARRYQVPDLEISSLEDLDLVKLIECEVAIFVVSTTGNGEIPRSMLDFWSTLLRQDLGSTLLDHLNFVILGLGDSKYLQFNWTAKKLRRRLLQLGAHELLDVVMCDDSANDGQDEALVPFNASYQDLLRQLNGDQEPIGSEVLLPPIEEVQLLKHKEGRPLQDNLSHALDSLKLSPGAKYQLSKLTKSTQLTPISFAPDVRLFDFQVSSELEILPGDVLSIVPSNSRDSVDRFLSLLNWQAEAETQVSVPRNSKVRALLDDLKYPTLRQLVTRVTPLHGIPSLSFFTQLRPFTTNEDFLEKFEEWETSEGKDDLYDYLTRPRRTLLEVLEDFCGGIRVPIEHCLDLFGVIVPRDYSIAGARRDLTIASTDNIPSRYCIQLLVALVKYQTKIKEPRQGQASRFLASFPVTETSDDEKDGIGKSLDSQLTLVEIKKPKASSIKMPLPTETTPLLLICTGTGLAPLRYLLQYLSDQDPDNEKLLDITIFFGCRSHDDDLLTLTLSPAIRHSIQIHHAYSRLPDQKKTYVQDALREKSEIVRKVLTADGVVYLCGSSGAMPDAVRAAIDDIHGPGTVETLESNGRWWQETW